MRGAGFGWRPSPYFTESKLMRLNIQFFETRPVAVEAILYDGSKQQAKAVIKLLAKHNLEGQYHELVSASRLDTGKPGPVESKAKLTIYNRGISQDEIPAGAWLVWDDSDNFKILDAAKFADTYRVRGSN